MPVPAVDSEEYLAPLWTQSFQEAPAEGVQPLVYSKEPVHPSIDRKTYLNNRLIFRSLQDHMRGKVRWEALEEWKAGWDRCRDAIQRLREEIDKRQREKMEAVHPGDGAIMKFVWIHAKDEITDNVIDALWKILKDSRLPVDYLPAREAQTAKDLAGILVGGGSREVTLTPRYSEGVELTMVPIAQDIMGDIAGLDSVKKLAGHLDDMVAAYGETGAKLNELLLRPVLLSTRCDLCPV